MTEWETAYAEMERVKAENAAFQPEFDRIHDAYEKGRPSEGDIPWKEFPLLSRHDVLHELDLDKYWQRFLDAENKAWWSNDGERTKERKREAIDAVRAYREAHRNNCEAAGIDQAIVRSDALGEQVAETEAVLLQLEAPDRAALLWKLEKLLEREGDSISPWDNDFVEQTRLDMRRLLAG